MRSTPNDDEVRVVQLIVDFQIKMAVESEGVDLEEALERYITDPP